MAAPATSWYVWASDSKHKKIETITDGRVFLPFFCTFLCLLPHRPRGIRLPRVYQNQREGTAPPCRGAGPTGLRGFTPTDTHIKYVFVDVRPLRRFAPPPLQGGGVYFDTPSTEYQDFQSEKIYLFKHALSHVFSESPCGLADSEIRIPHCAGLQTRRGMAYSNAAYFRI